MKTINDLNKHWWYRLLKVFYFLAIAYGLLISIGLPIALISDGDHEWYMLLFFCLIGLYITYVLAELLKRAFYYVVLGSVRPPKE